MKIEHRALKLTPETNPNGKERFCPSRARDIPKVDYVCFLPAEVFDQEAQDLLSRSGIVSADKNVVVPRKPFGR